MMRSHWQSDCQRSRPAPASESGSDPDCAQLGSDPDLGAGGAYVRDEGGRRIAVLISGRGSNLQALIDAIEDGRLRAEIAVVIANRADAAGLARARTAGIETVT